MDNDSGDDGTDELRQLGWEQSHESQTKMKDEWLKY